MNERHPLYQEALDADEAFTVELKRVYGNRHWEGRYLWAHKDEAVNEAKERKSRADDKWLAYMRGDRS